MCLTTLLRRLKLTINFLRFIVFFVCLFVCLLFYEIMRMDVQG